jgi:dipeptidyl aminopeptidase/acylaminoacyl peptidase
VSRSMSFPMQLTRTSQATASRMHPTPLARLVRRTFAVAAYLVLIIVVGGALVLLLQTHGKPQASQLPTAIAVASSPVTAPGTPGAAVHDTLVATNYYFRFDGEKPELRPKLSPDGGYVAWVSRQIQGRVAIEGITVYAVGIGVTRELTLDPTYHYSDLSWSPNSQVFAFAQFRAGRQADNLLEIWRIDADGGHRHRLFRATPTGNESLGVVPPVALGTWSPDGTTLALYETVSGGIAAPGTRLFTDGSGRIAPPVSSQPNASPYPTAAPALFAAAKAWPNTQLLGSSRDGRQMLVMRSASGAGVEDGVWHDGEIHLLTLDR